MANKGRRFWIIQKNH